MQKIAKHDLFVTLCCQRIDQPIAYIVPRFHMNTEAPSATPASNAPRLKRIFKRSAWIVFLALLNVWMAQAQTPSNIPASEGPTTINGCPVRLDQLRPLRGFRLGKTLTE